MTSEYVIEQLERFAAQLIKLTVVVFDNAPIHRTKEFARRMSGWSERGLFIFYLPKASPHLNKAETFWRKAKYEWLKPTDYASFAKYKRKIKEIFNGIGLQYKVNFKELKDKIYFV